ncbi:MAG TPA: hypothetical protein VKA61_08600 [Sphingomicrobium sp.]|nr:hypothetical protein [Sphingomicrobium sp.]
MAESKAHHFNLRIDDQANKLLDRIAKRFSISRAQAVRQGLAIAVSLVRVAQQQSLAGLAALRERYGDEARLILSVSQGADGTARGHVLIDGHEPEDVEVNPVPVNGKVLIFLNLNSGLAFREQALAIFGNEKILVSEARYPLGELPWPPDPRRGLVITLGDLDRIITADHEVLQA